MASPRESTASPSPDEQQSRVSSSDEETMDVLRRDITDGEGSRPASPERDERVTTSRDGVHSPTQRTFESSSGDEVGMGQTLAIRSVASPIQDQSASSPLQAQSPSTTVRGYQQCGNESTVDGGLTNTRSTIRSADCADLNMSAIEAAGSEEGAAGDGGGDPDADWWAYDDYLESCGLELDSDGECVQRDPANMRRVDDYEDFDGDDMV